MDARERLDRAIMELSAAHAELDSVALESKLVPHPERAKVGDLAWDVMEAARLLRLVQDEASTMSWQAAQVASQMTRPPDWVHEPGISREEFFARSREWYASQNLEELAAEMVRSTEASAAAQPSVARLRVVFKLIFFVVRAYQDGLCRLGLWLSGQSAGRYTSMNKALTTAGHPVGDLLRSRVPEYPEWFSSWRDQRNQVKEGANFGIAGPEADLGISFAQVTKENSLVVNCSPEAAVRMSHVAEAIEMSTRVILALRSIVTMPAK